MGVETLTKREAELSSKVPKIEIKEADNPAEILELVKKELNYLRNDEEILAFFKLRENQAKDGLFFTADCELKSIHKIRNEAVDFLIKRGVINQDEIIDFKTLIGEVIRDTFHSTRQGFTNPKFTIRMFNLNNPEKFSFDIINPDGIPCSQWSRFSIKESEKKITGFEKGEEGIGLGASLLERFAQDLKAKIWYSDIKNEKGEKEYTLFHFEKTPKSGV